MSYFNPFPYIGYTFPDHVTRAYKNLSIRPAVVDELLTDYSNLQTYYVQDGETPETIAYDKYGSVNFNWAVMLANNIMNLYIDWPLAQSTLDDVIYEKYSIQLDSDGVERTLTEDQVYEFISFVGQPDNNYTSYILLHDSDNSPKIKIRPHHFEDEDENYYELETVNNNVDAFGREVINPTLTPVSIWTYETNINDAKRAIFLPTKEVVNKMDRELRRLVNE